MPECKFGINDRLAFEGAVTGGGIVGAKSSSGIASGSRGGVGDELTVGKSLVPFYCIYSSAILWWKQLFLK